jgi:hypothetical protein
MAEDITQEIMRKTQANLAELKATVARMEIAPAEMNDVLGELIDSFMGDQAP